MSPHTHLSSPVILGAVVVPSADINITLGTSYGSLPTYVVGVKFVAFNHQYIRQPAGYALDSHQTTNNVYSGESGKDLAQLLRDLNANWVHWSCGPDNLGALLGTTDPITNDSGFADWYRAAKFLKGGTIGGTNYGTVNPYAQVCVAMPETALVSQTLPPI